MFQRVATVICHLSSFLYNCRESSTNSPLFMQNEPNFQKSQMSVNLYITTNYENKRNWTLGENEPNRTQLKPIQSQNEPNSNPIKAKKYAFSLAHLA